MSVNFEKVCTKCGQTKPVSAFKNDKRYEDGKSRRCRECTNEIRRNWYSNLSAERRRQVSWSDRPDQRKRRTIKQYGLSWEDYNVMLTAQASGCAICRCTPEEGYRGLCVDHDHDTGQVRALLCNRHNGALGLIGEDVEVLEAMISYVRKHKHGIPEGWDAEEHF